MYEYEKGDKTKYEEWYDKQYTELGCYHWDSDKGTRQSNTVCEQLEHDDNILDVGCGDGWEMFKLMEMGKKVTGVEISNVAIDMAKDKIKERLGVDPDIRKDDCTNLSLDDNSFDAVLCGDVIEHLTVEDQEKLLKEIKRVCKPGGRIVLSTANRHDEIKIVINPGPQSSSHIKEYTLDEMKNIFGRQFKVEKAFTGGGFFQLMKIAVPVPDSKTFLVGRNVK